VYHAFDVIFSLHNNNNNNNNNKFCLTPPIDSRYDRGTECYHALRFERDILVLALCIFSSEVGGEEEQKNDSVQTTRSVASETISFRMFPAAKG